MLTNLSGNELDVWWQEQLGETDFKWMAQYGNAWRIGGCFGVWVHPLLSASPLLIAPIDGTDRRTSSYLQTRGHYNMYLGGTTTPSVRTSGKQSVS